MPDAVEIGQEHMISSNCSRRSKPGNRWPTVLVKHRPPSHWPYATGATTPPARWKVLGMCRPPRALPRTTSEGRLNVLTM